MKNVSPVVFINISVVEDVMTGSLMLRLFPSESKATGSTKVKSLCEILMSSEFESGPGFLNYN